MLNANQVANTFLIFLLIKVVVELWLEQRNKINIAKHQEEVPEQFREKIDLESHQKAAAYSLEKIKVGRISRLYGLVLLLGWTAFGGLNYLDVWARTFNYTELQTGLLVFAAFAIIGMILGLPESLYSTFVLEEKYGFNKTTWKTFITDQAKGLLLGAIIGLPLLAGILSIIIKLGDTWWIYAWVFLTLFQLVLMWAYPTLIAPLFNKFTPLEDGELKEVVMKLLEKTGFFSKGLFVMNASMRSAHGNAYFTGFGKNKRIVFFDTLINSLDPEEVEAVLAHELGHFKRKHILKGLVRAIGMSFLGFGVLGLLYKSPEFFNGHGVALTSSYMAILLFSMVSGIYTFLLTPVGSLISRKYEFEADEFASEYAKAEKLITALVKMYKDNASTLTPDPIYSNFYHSHPPALIRVEHLQKLSDARA
jgi:STE24 endopeptidase